MPITGLPLTFMWIAVAGAIGGALNALLSDDFSLAPSIIRVTPRVRLVRPGLSVSTCLGALAGAGACAAFSRCVSCAVPGAPSELLVAATASLLVGFASARWLSSEADKRLLRAAVCKAAAAPAGHPDTVRALQIASPRAVYELALELMPPPASRR